jgi:hypothetical protein
MSDKPYLEAGTRMNLLTLSARSYSRSHRYLKAGPNHFLMYVFGRFGVVRSFMVWLYSQRTTKPLSYAGPTLVEEVDVDDVVLRISQNGFSAGLHLRKDVVEQLLAFASVATCYGDGKDELPFRYGDQQFVEQQTARPFRLGRYKNMLSASPLVRALTSDTQLLAVARKYLRTEPVLVGARMWWSFPGPADPEQQVEAGQGFHYDIDGYRALTFFFYLTGVGPSNGPHVYVRKTHVKKLWRHLVSVYKGRRDAEIEKCYGAERQILICGPAGSGFAEDIFGFHKGLHPETGDRLILQLRYGLRDYGTGHQD